MPTASTYAGYSDAGSFHQMDRFAGGSNSAMQNFLYPVADRDVVYKKDDFDDVSINTFFWTTTNAANATALAIPATQVAGGVAVANTGPTANEAVSAYGPVIYLGDNHCGTEIRLQMDGDLANTTFEFGFVDPLTNFSLKAVNDIDTPSITNGAADVALVSFDGAQTLKTLAFITDGSTTNMNTTKTNLGTRILTDNTYMTIRVWIAGNSASCQLWDANYAPLESASHGSTTASQIEGGTLLLPWLHFQTREAASHIITIDYWKVWMNRIAPPA